MTRPHGLLLLVLAIAPLVWPGSVAEARPPYRDALQNQMWPVAGARPLVLGCETCHSNPDGGLGCPSPPCLQPFGLSVARELADGHASDFWRRIATQDADGDGYSNALELGDRDGDGVFGIEGGRYPTPFTPPGRNDGDLDECALGIATCGPGLICSDRNACHPDDRPSFVCEVEPSPEPPPPYIDTPWGDAPAVSLGEWVEVDTLDASNVNIDTACGLSEASAWARLDLDGTCETGRVRVEREWVDGRDPGPTTLSFGRSDPLGCAPPTETACGASESGVSPAGANMARVFGRWRGRMRFVCVHDEGAACAAPVNACEDLHGHCDMARPVADGEIVRVAVEPGAACGEGNDRSVHLRYVATCSGTVLARSVLVEQENTAAGVTLEALPGVCGAAGPYACGHHEGELFAYSRDHVTLKFPAIEGQQFTFRVSGTVRPHEELVAIRCVERLDRAYLQPVCDPLATLKPDTDPLQCICPPGYAGDGQPVARGGTGCDYQDLCEAAGLTCVPGSRCTPFGAGADLRGVCVCDEGYLGHGHQECVDVDHCARSGTDPCTGQPFAECLNLVGAPGPICVCSEGYPSETTSGVTRCVPRCGDGVRAIGEECDDGNSIDGDGCDHVCEVERGYRCFEHPNELSYCSYVCDNDAGLIYPGCDEPGDDSGCGVSGTARGMWSLLLALLWASRRRRTTR